MWNFKEDYSFWINKEEEIVTYLESLWYSIESNWKTSVHDWRITNEWRTVHIELKSRRVECLKYDDTLIWANKLGEAWNKYYKDWEETLFFFSYTDWLYYINPLNIIPNNREYKKFRWDRWEFDKPKWWVLYNVRDLKKIC